MGHVAIVEMLSLIMNISMIIITAFWVYNMIVSIGALFKIKEKPKLVDKKHSFMVIIPAHNEEVVVGNLVKSLKNLDYDNELYDTYVIADNCTDSTAQVAKDAGAIVYERFHETKKTKGYALNWFFKKMTEENKKYDAIIIFDADNVVDKNFLNAMNLKLCQGEKLVQGYRDIKNPTDTWISGGYAIFYWMMNKFYHLARYNIGLSPLINGTAFMVEWSLLMPNGWNTKTLTEDIEFSIINIANGTKLGWAKDAIVYDEQPLTFKQSWSQRERWSVGHVQVIKGYTGDLVKGVIREKTIMNVDGFFYVLGMPLSFLTLGLVILNTILYLMGEMGLSVLLENYTKYIVSTYVFPVIAAVLVLLIDRRPIRPMLKAILMYPIFMGSWLLINIKVLFKPNTKWEKIQHTKSVTIEEMQNT